MVSIISFNEKLITRTVKRFIPLGKEMISIRRIKIVRLLNDLQPHNFCNSASKWNRHRRMVFFEGPNQWRMSVKYSVLHGTQVCKEEFCVLQHTQSAKIELYLSVFLYWPPFLILVKNTFHYAHPQNNANNFNKITIKRLKKNSC